MTKIQIDTPMIRLNRLLKYINEASSGGQAKVMIQAGEVELNHETCTVVRKQIFPGDTVSVNGEDYLITEQDNDNQ